MLLDLKASALYYVIGIDKRKRFKIAYEINIIVE